MKEQHQNMNRQQDLNSELKELSPYLLTLPRELPFQAPEDYFINAPEFILQAVSGKEPVAGFMTTAAGHPFETPENYFDELPAVVLSRIGGQPKKIHRINSYPVHLPSIQWKVWLAAASVAALIITSITLFTYQPQQDNSRQELATATSAESSLLLSVADVDESIIVDLVLQEQVADAATDAMNPQDPSLMDVMEFDEQSLSEI